MYKTSLKFVYFLTLLYLILIIDGCVKDKCKTVFCQHNGSCVDGTCSCPDGYSGANCETCSRVCQNGHLENDCSCNCLDGYSGANCETCSRVCQNGYLENDCSCNCLDGYSGANCENRLPKLILYDSIGIKKEIFYDIKGDTLKLLKSNCYLTVCAENALFFRSANCTGNCFWVKGTYPDVNRGNTITFVGVDSVYVVNQWFTQDIGQAGGLHFTFHRHSWKGVTQ